MNFACAQTSSNTFTATHPNYLASKVQTDLLRLHRYYYHEIGFPNLNDIRKYHKELVLLQKYNLLDEIEYGFVYKNSWVKALKYSLRQGGLLIRDEDPGGIIYSKIIKGAEFESLVFYNANWSEDSAETIKFKRESPIVREKSATHDGEWFWSRSYGVGARGFVRSEILANPVNQRLERVGVRELISAEISANPVNQRQERVGGVN